MNGAGIFRGVGQIDSLEVSESPVAVRISDRRRARRVGAGPVYSDKRPPIPTRSRPLVPAESGLVECSFSRPCIRRLVGQVYLPASRGAHYVLGPKRFAPRLLEPSFFLRFEVSTPCVVLSGPRLRRRSASSRNDLCGLVGGPIFRLSSHVLP